MYPVLHIKWRTFSLPLPFLLLLVEKCLADLQIGDTCALDSQTTGICRSIHLCPSAREALRRRSRPVHCGFSGSTPIVCCPTPQNPQNSNAARLSSSKKAGDAAKAMCEQIRMYCEDSFPQREKRNAEMDEIPDYDDFGTTTANPEEIETTTQYYEIEKTLPGIVGGSLTLLNEFPHMAAVGFGEENRVSWECGGTLISEKFVLTAAHCLYSGARPAQWVQLGTNGLNQVLQRDIRLENAGQVHRVMRKIRHPEYNRTSKYNDMALLEIGPPFTAYSKLLMSKEIHPACLQTEDDDNIENAFATGWGRVGHGEDQSPFLLKVELTVLNRSVCNDSYKVEIRTSNLYRGIDGTMICSGKMEGGKDTCQGDSGGPLQISMDRKHCRYNVFGVTSFGKICGFANSPAIYMRIWHFIPWIESIVWPET